MQSNSYGRLVFLHETGAAVFEPPPDSPDLNSIKRAFSNLKSLLRTTAERATEGLWIGVGELLGEFTAGESVYPIRSCGSTAR